MNRGAFQSFPVHQMVGGSPIWWDLNNMGPPTDHQQISPLFPSSSSSTTPSSSSSSALPHYTQSSSLQAMTSWHDNQELPESWSQLLLGGLVEEEDRCSYTPFQAKRMENWEDQVLYPSDKGYVYGQAGNMINEEIQAARSSWSQILPNSSPRSCVTTSLNSSMLDFSNNKPEKRHHQLDLSSECNSTPTGSPYKKPRVQTSTAQSTFKVRKEKLGDRITALHQLVSPFGKTDTASVLLEAIGYIRFLQSQIEALSSPYLGSTGSGGNIKQSAEQGERSGIFPEDPGQDGVDEPKEDLKSRGLCLVPLSFTMHVGNDNAADYWAPTFGGGFR